MRVVGAVLAAGLLLSACGTSQPSEQAEAAADAPVPGWLRAMAEPDPPAASCAVRYPEDLPEQPIAFDGTIAAVTRGDYDENAAGTPVTLEFQVNEVFNGALEPTLEVRTWDFSPPASRPSDDTIGLRLLAAMSEHRDLMACGFTRLYDKADAAAWRAAYRQ